MEGYLLRFHKPRRAEMLFCALEHGAIHFYDRPGGEGLGTLPLTRHRIRVVMDLDGACPNQLAVHSLELARDDDRRCFVPVSTDERVEIFAAPTVDKMRAWARAIHNWRRHTFTDPVVVSVKRRPCIWGHDESAGGAIKTAASRDAVFGDEAALLTYMESTFDFQITKARPDASRARARTATIIINKRNPEVRLSLPIRPSQVVAMLPSWLPPRLRTLRRVSSTTSA